ncbi:hypothetical protein GXB85_08090 [Cellulomonas sp. APG4]|uniref:hypothetical protein n=1 Tax=Cellulomonas sp. APG4 TaxID=1538656 RepID=UPI001379C6D3|nr:hypothetical protein [Cellulomonas sp. APG4]NCT90907.1 hypothetical protein [Cellulomonas sp. APG4]
MSWSEVAVVVGAALVLAVWWVWVAASRLDRLHRKVASSRSALENQLVRRASVAAELAGSGLLDPASTVLVGEAAWTALGAREVTEETPRELAEALAGTAHHVAGPDDREAAESELSRTLRIALDDRDEVAELSASPLGHELLAALAATWYRVQLSRRFHNEAVAQTQRVRRKPAVRLLRLHGHAPVPHTVEIDDGWPDWLTRPGQVG